MLWFIFALSSAVAKTIVDVQTKALSEDSVTLAVYRYACAAIAGWIAGVFLGISLSWSLVAYASLAAVIELTGFFLLYKALRKGEISTLSPIMGFSPLLTAVIGVLFMQYLSVYAWIGIVSICLGIVLTKRIAWNKATAYMFGSMLSFSLLPLIFQRGIVIANIQTMIIVTFSICALVLLCKKRPVPTRSRITYGTLYVAEIAGQFIALSMAPAALVMGVKRFSVVITSVIGIVFLRERTHMSKKILSAALVFIGTVLLVL